MTARTLFGLTCAIAIGLGLCGARAESTWQESTASEDWMHDFTVLTLAPDGAWGAATDPFVNRAIAGAITKCKAMSGAELGCGAYLSSIRTGWSLGICCGREII